VCYCSHVQPDLAKEFTHLAPATVVIVSSRSLFAEGVAARLRQQLGDEALLVSYGHDAAAAVEQISRARPAMVVFDGTDPEVDEECLVGSLLVAMPHVRVVRLDPFHDQVQVVTSEQRTAFVARDLLDVLRANADGACEQPCPPDAKEAVPDNSPRVTPVDQSIPSDQESTA
jgi:DNA-binding NarL/FixJ family response regulator